MQQALWQNGMDIIKVRLEIIHLETMLVQTDVLKECCVKDEHIMAENNILDQKYLAARSAIKKQGKAMRAVELCEEQLSGVAEGSKVAKDLRKKNLRICARHAKK
jgi:hypothetical protein